MYHVACFPGKYIQGKGTIGTLKQLIRQFGDNAFILASPKASQYIPAELRQKPASAWLTTAIFGGECSEQELDRIAHLIGQNEPQVMVGMGGGKTIDAAKIATDRAGLPVIVVPTIASTDAPCSGCAVTYTSEGIFEKVHYQRMNPAVVLVDTEILAKAPARFLVAGMGDALATWFEARACAASGSLNECGGVATNAGRQLARLCYDLLLEHGLQAMLDNEAGRISPAFEHIVEANILLSGIGFESGGLGAAHAIHNGLTELPEAHTYYHGEKVAFGLLSGLHLTDACPDEINEVYEFCASIGLPVTLAELGIDVSNSDALMRVANKSAEAGSSIHHEGEDITAGKVFEAIVKADAYGHKILSNA